MPIVKESIQQTLLRVFCGLDTVLDAACKILLFNKEFSAGVGRPSIKRQIVNILGFAGHKVTTATT